MNPCPRCYSKTPPVPMRQVRYVGGGWLLRAFRCTACGALNWISQRVGRG